MKTITFYSYKGGVGRTLAAANFAVYLAKLGLRVVLMDFDLDAPGVDSKFPNLKLPTGCQGLIDFILDFQRSGAPPGPIKKLFYPIPVSVNTPVQFAKLASSESVESVRIYELAKNLKLDSKDLVGICQNAGIPKYTALEKLTQDEVAKVLQYLRGDRIQYSLGLIPAGDYREANYPAKLSELNWRFIFSPERHGAAYFRAFIKQISAELHPDVLIIDSRTGFNEIGGLCTQLLADETVFLSSVANESVEMSSRLAQMIRESANVSDRGKRIETKIVISRVPRPDDIEKYKSHWCQRFNVDESHLFFLFQSNELAAEEFVAMLSTQRDQELVANYVTLFHGLDVKVAHESMLQAFDRLLQLEIPELVALDKIGEADARVDELVALYPIPEVYRKAMRHFKMRSEFPEKVCRLAQKLLKFIPDDKEAQREVARYALRDNRYNRLGIPRRVRLREVGELVPVLLRAYQAGDLSVKELIRLAEILEQIGESTQSYEIAKQCLEDPSLNEPEIRRNAMGIVARTAVKIGNKNEAIELLKAIPVEELDRSLANLALDLRIEAGDREGALSLATMFLEKGIVPGILEKAARLAQQLGHEPQLQKIVSDIREVRNFIAHRPEVMHELEQLGIEIGRIEKRFRSPYPSNKE